MGLRKYHLMDGEGDMGELEGVTPIREPLVWSVPFTERNREYLELAAEALLKAQSPLGHELMLILVQANLTKPAEAA